MDNLLNEANKGNPAARIKFCDETTFPIEKVVSYEEINGRKFPRVYWSDIVKQYPGMWACFLNSEVVLDDRLEIMTMISLCSDEESNDTLVSLFKQGYRVEYQRTTSNFIGGMLC